MVNAKQAKLSGTLKLVELIKQLSLELAPLDCITARQICDEVRRTLINQAGEIQSLTNRNEKLQKKCDSNSQYENCWDSLIFAIMGADAEADIINVADIERTNAAAMEAVSKLASERDEKQRVAEAFQAVSNSYCIILSSGLGRML